MSRRVWPLVLAGVALVLASCGVDIPDEIEVGSAEVEAPGFTDDAELVVSFAYPYLMQARGGAVAFVREDGSASVMEVQGQDNALTAAGPDRRVALSTNVGGVLLGGDGSESWRYEQQDGTGHWSGFDPDGWALQVINSGYGAAGYITDVYAQNDGLTRHSVIPDIPEAVGVADGAVWMTSSGENPRTAALYRAPYLEHGPVRRVMSWTPTGLEDRRDYVPVSGLFEHDGALWYLEETTARARDGGDRNVWVARLDPATGSYRATAVSTPFGMIFDARGDVVSVSAATTDGHLYDGRIYVVDAARRLVAVDLDTAEVEVVTTLSDVSRDPWRALVAWEGSTMTVVVFTTDDRVVWEEYDLDTGALRTRPEIPDLAELYADNRDLVPWSIAALAGDG